MRSMVIVKTASGSTYVLSVSEPGVHWCRLPAMDCLTAVSMPVPVNARRW